MSSDADHNFGNPKGVVMLSGKRKSGKDFVANLLLERLGMEDCVIVRLSAPLKERYALENNLDYSRLLDSSSYKELHRFKMIEWGERIRNSDSGYFCRHALAGSGARGKNFWIVSDARRKSDVEFFKQHFTHVWTVRINATEVVRTLRGWVFTPGVDDAESECGLDDFDLWNFRISNNNSDNVLEDVDEIISVLQVHRRSDKE